MGLLAADFGQFQGLGIIECCEVSDGPNQQRIDYRLRVADTMDRFTPQVIECVVP